MKMTDLIRLAAVAVTLGILASSVSAQRPQREGAQQGRPLGGPPGGATGLFGIFDSDDDGTLAESEVPGPVWDRLSAADANEDGSVTQDEVTAFQSARGNGAGDKQAKADGRPAGRPQGPPWAPARAMFQRFDEDRDGALVEDEVPGLAWLYLSRADVDKDGSVTQEEVIVLVGSRMFDRFDDNQDNVLTENEVPGLMWDRFGAADADEDGGVSLDEFVDAVLSAPRGGMPESNPGEK
ncbi:MAG: Ca2+-binding EF-hand superfamily protein [Planctomycetaceae bacterium]|jgi:Ca2+-binding EF-hand superfamily protein